MSIAESRVHNNAIVSLLIDADLVVGDGGDPTVPFGWQATPGQSQFIPYCLVFPLAASYSGGLGCPDTDADLGWQVTCVGSTREQCDWVLDAANAVLIGARVDLDDRWMPRIRPDGGAGTRRDDTTQPPLYIATPRFAAISTGA